MPYKSRRLSQIRKYGCSAAKYAGKRAMSRDYQAEWYHPSAAAAHGAPDADKYGGRMRNALSYLNPWAYNWRRRRPQEEEFSAEEIAEWEKRQQEAYDEMVKMQGYIPYKPGMENWYIDPLKYKASPKTKRGHKVKPINIPRL